MVYGNKRVQDIGLEKVTTDNLSITHVRLALL